MFGARMGNKYNKFTSDKANEVFDKIIKLTSKPNLGKAWKLGPDQDALNAFIWPYAKQDSVVHDSYLCKRYPSTDIRPFPTRRVHEWMNYVGSYQGEITLQKHGPCPEECRPKEHKDWTIC